MKTPTLSVWIGIGLIWLMSIPAGNASAQEAILADHTFVTTFDQIPAEIFETIRDDYHFFYGHTSHGSQIMSGLGALAAEDSEKYQVPHFHEISDDLGHNGDTSWVQPTRDWLDNNPDCNMVLWSWCGGASDNTEAGINIYLEAMTQLETEYPSVTFVYMTGHLDGGGPDGNLYQMNNLIRDYCATNNKVLFDFADIESWDPDGNYYPNENDGCSWCYSWCEDNGCSSCGSCAHSHCFNCYQKGKAFWSMMAAIAGESLSPVQEIPTAADIQIRNFPNPFNPQTDIHLRIDQPGAGSLGVYDLSGNLVTVLFSGQFSAGEQSFRWNGRDDQGRLLGSGIYFCRLVLAGQQTEIKMTLLK